MATLKILHPHPAVLLETDLRYVAVSDLHIGFENQLSGRGINISPEKYLDEMLDELSYIIQKEEPDVLLLLGDIKSSVHTVTKTEWRNIPEFLHKLSKMCKVFLIPGNHDAGIQHLVPKEVRMMGSKGMMLDDTLLVHGHTMPSKISSSVSRIVMGHIHPIFLREGSVLNGQRVWVYLKVNKQQVFSDTKGILDMIVLPSFNKYFYYSMQSKTYRKSISPIINKAVQKVSKAMVLTLDGSILGNESLLEQII
ncbi:MAG: metallophosphoesterase [Thermodesulfobacteriota bacterium]